MQHCNPVAEFVFGMEPCDAECGSRCERLRQLCQRCTLLKRRFQRVNRSERFFAEQRFSECLASVPLLAFTALDNGFKFVKNAA